MSLDPAAFIHAHRYGVLSSHSASHPGYPFGSVVPYLVDADGHMLIHISELAEHSKNIAVDPRVALTIADIRDDSRPVAGARITCLADAEICNDQHGPRELYARRFSDAEMILQLPGFVFYRLDLQAVRLVAGFGDIRWLAPGELDLRLNVAE